MTETVQTGTSDNVDVRANKIGQTSSQESCVAHAAAMQLRQCYDGILSDAGL